MWRRTAPPVQSNARRRERAVSSGESVRRRFARSVREAGLATTLVKGARLPWVKLNEARRDLWLHWLTRTNPPEVVFSEIHRRKYWSGGESVSGYGSTMESTANLRAQLHAFMNARGIRSIFDAPCGDFHWMRHVVTATAIEYRGVDIVPALIAENIERYARTNVCFNVSDITSQAFPRADLWICRDCLFHLSYADIARALRNFVASEIPYVLTTTYEGTGRFVNKDIHTGGFRRIDLCAAPFSFPTHALAHIDDTPPGDQPRSMTAWTRQQIADALPAFERATSQSRER
jgi:hypothetical protein